ncbi:MAG: LEA type 2 family protein [Proteobacteria bacterium]|nr:LEA type 2 family protein [Pseudomonadota bacterium]
MRHVIPILLLATLLNGCAIVQQILQPPTISFSRAEYRATDFDSLDMDLVFLVSNPNPLGAQMEGYSIKLVVDGLTLLDGDVDQVVDLSGGATTEIVVPASLRWMELADKIQELAEGEPVPDTVPWSAEGDVRFMTPLGELGLPFNVGGDAPVIAPPVIQPVNARVEPASFTAVRMEVDVAVKNVMGRATGFKRLDQQLRIGGNAIVSSRIMDGESIPAHSTEIRTVAFELDALQVGAALVAAIAAGGEVDVALVGDAQVDTGIGVIPLSFNTAEGLMPSLGF